MPIGRPAFDDKRPADAASCQLPAANRNVKRAACLSNPFSSASTSPIGKPLVTSSPNRSNVKPESPSLTIQPSKGMLLRTLLCIRLAPRALPSTTHTPHPQRQPVFSTAQIPLLQILHPDLQSVTSSPNPAPGEPRETENCPAGKSPQLQPGNLDAQPCLQAYCLPSHQLVPLAPPILYPFRAPRL